MKKHAIAGLALFIAGLIANVVSLWLFLQSWSGDEFTFVGLLLLVIALACYGGVICMPYPKVARLPND
jgi:hypothetical protein